jgi:uncharacterized protein (DUF305 family)
MRTLLILALLIGGAQAQGVTTNGGMADMPGMKPADAFGPAMAKMHHDMAVAPTGDIDRDFVNGMIPHHQGAVDMAEVELARGHDPALKKLARDIIAAQRREIAFMKAWAAKHPAPTRSSP